MSRLLLATATILPLLAISSALFSGGSTPEQHRAVDELEYVLHTADGERLEAHFLVAAADDAEAARAARAAIEQLHPGASVEVPGHERAASLALGDEDEAPVNAQWGSWGWSWGSEELPVPVGYNPAGALAGTTEADIVTALETWSGVEGSSFGFEYTGVTDRDASMNTNGEDGANVIAWQDLDCDGGCVLGLTTKSFQDHEVDISLNTNPGARLDEGAYDVLTVLIHELGHVAGLEHSCPALGPCTDEEAEAVMFYSYSGVRHELTSDDIAGLVDTYPAGASSTSPAGEDPAVSRSDGAEESSSVHIEVEPGWNLQSLPGPAVDEIASSLACVDAIYAYHPDDGWSHWVRGLDSSLQTLRQTEGEGVYWLLASGSCSAFYH